MMNHVKSLEYSNKLMMSYDMYAIYALPFLIDFSVEDLLIILFFHVTLFALYWNEINNDVLLSAMCAKISSECTFLFLYSVKNVM